MTRFRRSGDQLLLALADYEEAVLESMVEQLIDLLEGDGVRPQIDDQFDRWEAEMAAPGDLDISDPVIARLFPPAYRDDEKAEAEFRRFTESAQRRAKIAQARVVLHALLETSGGRDPAVIRGVDVDAWLKTIAALRLTLSVRLGIADAEDVEELEELDAEDPRGVMYNMYEWLGYLLEDLLDKLH